jgi:NAD-dependent deacetylase
MSKHQSIVVLTGAGVSAESGIQTFRAADGLWEQHRIEDVATPEGFTANPALVHQFYNDRRKQLLSDEVQANNAHFALAKLERSFNGQFLLVTQNIDNLHEESGSQNVLHMHGELLKMRCCFSGQIFDIKENITTKIRCQCCDKQGSLRPHIVWFGEMPLYMDEIETALMTCDLFLSIGTSGNVYPAAGFVQQANHYGAHTVEINLEPSATESDFDEHIYGKAGTVLPDLVEHILSA